ncbi:gag-Pol polyprotein [Caerostris darwini]|uniref:Gag-Pol polyprotein n=1 Tax=Caerostris darwini TaxID=1538125 RepID=A0AAV4VUS7_9ARAC|nr:gag-Pol polyprotein [Caerostris darwini]
MVVANMPARTSKKEQQTVDEVFKDFKAVVEKDNFVAIPNDRRERIELKQDQKKKQFDKKWRQVLYTPSDKVWETLHPISKSKNKMISMCLMKRDGLYLILIQKSPTSYVIAALTNQQKHYRHTILLR